MLPREFPPTLQGLAKGVLRFTVKRLVGKDDPQIVKAHQSILVMRSEQIGASL
jgi:hypothetical protein